MVAKLIKGTLTYCFERPKKVGLRCASRIGIAIGIYFTLLRITFSKKITDELYFKEKEKKKKTKPGIFILEETLQKDRLKNGKGSR